MPPHSSSPPNGDVIDHTGSTHHTPAHLLPMGEDSVMDETGTTRHEPLDLKDDEKAAEDLDVEPTATEDTVKSAGKGGDVTSSQMSQQEMQAQRLHRKVAEIAAKAYRRASEQSNVLSKAKLADIALVKFEELEIGKFLGKGSFSNVHEITKVTCIDASDRADDDESWDGGSDDDGTEHQRTTALHSNRSTKVKDPRKLLTQHHMRMESGTFRYAIKFLKEEIRASPQKYAIGTSDLVVEGMFLASLAHPNIIKVRGLPEGGVKSLVKGNRTNGYFLILDRLFDTLSERIYGEWQGEHVMTVAKSGCLPTLLPSRKGSARRDGDLAVRLKVAFDISAALKYLHSKSIIYRDLKPENLGFDGK